MNSHDPQYMSLINTSRWRKLRALKLSAAPYCERCDKEFGITTLAVMVHHIEPIEKSHNYEEMKRRCYDANNLMSVCLQCHHDIHNSEGYHTAANQVQLKKDRAMAAFEKFCGKQNDDGV